MFRKRNPQGNLFESSFLLPEEKYRRLKSSWADVFREKALDLIHEEPLAQIYHEDNGRPNRPVQVVFGVLLLKEMYDLTDSQALEQLEFNLLWQHALRRTPEEAHLAQKTLYNFREGVSKHDLAKLAFEEATDRIIAALGIRTGRQRLDSTHITSNFAHLTRLQLFCETIRLFLSTLSRQYPELFLRVSERLRGRYLRENGEGTRFGDARSAKVPRRLTVCARDVGRLLSIFGDTEASGLQEYGKLERLLGEQCDVTRSEGKPKKGDEDQGEDALPVAAKEAKEVGSDSMQTPHDSDVTYSGHKGKGYSVQICETCDEENPVQILTHVEVTDACQSDVQATVPVIQALTERGHQPEELYADTPYGSAQNVHEAARMGTEVVSPVGGTPLEQKVDLEDPQRPLEAADFDIDVRGQRPAICPAGQASIAHIEHPGAPHRVKIHFEKQTCEACPHRQRCPATLHVNKDCYILSVDLIKLGLVKRRRAEASGEFAPRYAVRAGIEGTNSELKRSHGLGHLRVRGRPRVRMVVYLKALACNIKRMVRACLDVISEMEPAMARQAA